MAQPEMRSNRKRNLLHSLYAGNTISCRVTTHKKARRTGGGGAGRGWCGELQTGTQGSRICINTRRLTVFGLLGACFYER